MERKKAEMRDQRSLEDEHREILESLRVSAAVIFGEKWVKEVNVREALEASARAVWLIRSESLDPMESETYRND